MCQEGVFGRPDVGPRGGRVRERPNSSSTSVDCPRGVVTPVLRQLDLSVSGEAASSGLDVVSTLDDSGGDDSGGSGGSSGGDGFLPIAGNDYYLMTHDYVPIAEYPPGLLSNDTSEDDILSVTLVSESGPEHAVVFTFGTNGLGSFYYRSEAEFAGFDSFCYYCTDEDESDDGMLTFSMTEPPLQAAEFEFNSDGTFTYTPSLHYVGLDSFDYEVTDGARATATASVSIEVTNQSPTSSDISEVFHWAQDETNQQINLWDVFDDSDDTDQQLTYSIVGTPDAGVVSTSIDQGTGVLTLDFGSTPGTTEVTVRATDRCGEQVDTAFDVWVVEVTGCTAERQLDDGSWVSVPHSEVSWSHDTMRWTAQVAPEGVTVYSVDWQTTAWEDRDDPFATWTSFAASSGLEAAEGTPPVGELAVSPYVSFPGVSVRMDPAVRKIVAEITSIQWATHSNAQTAAELYDSGVDIQAHPDATSPGGSLRPNVDVLVQVTPQIAGISIVIESLDVDDPSDDDGPIDADPAPIDYNYMYMRPENGIDNLGGVGAGSLDATPRETDANGQIRVTFDMGAQPGNNFRVVAGGRQEDLDRVLARSADPNSEVFYDNDGNGIFNPEAYGGYEGGDLTLSETMSVRNLVATRRLTVWRYLHVEVDSMGNVTGNTLNTAVVQRRDNEDGTSKVELTTTVPTQFVSGTLTDSVGNAFEILAVLGNFLIQTKNLSGNTIPFFGAASIRDDDHLLDGQDVPMPDTSQLGNAMAEAFVEVLYDVGDSNDNVPFVLNVTDPVSAMDWDSKSDNSVGYWVAYVLGAFQGPAGVDNDPDTEPVVGVGATPVDYGGSLIYIEAIVDIARQCGWNATLTEQDTVVHEVGHAVADSRAEPVTRRPSEPGRYTEEYLKEIRESTKPRD